MEEGWWSALRNKQPTDGNGEGNGEEWIEATVENGQATVGNGHATSVEIIPYEAGKNGLFKLRRIRGQELMRTKLNLSLVM